MICLDPGITTGMAVLDARGDIMATTVWGTGELRQSLDVLVRYLHTHGYQTHAVIERVPRNEKASPIGAKLEHVRADIMGLIDDTYAIPYALVMPGEWKPSRVARTTKLPKEWRGDELTQHQKDAILMGRYVLDAIHRQPRARVRCLCAH